MMGLFGAEAIASGIVPRDYQVEDVNKSFDLWDSGTIGTLTRAFTGAGKTIMTCLKFKRWLERGPNYRCMVLSYEQELVRQFAQEVEDVLGSDFTLEIEMASQEIKPGFIPQIVIASRQSLMTHELATEEQREELRKFGLNEIGLLTKAAARRVIAALQAEGDLQKIADGIAEHNSDYRCDHKMKRVSRLYKFDWRDNWLLACDEAHKFSMGMKSVGHIVEWFEQNPQSRRSGVTATPKRRDNVNIGYKLFPGISLDYPFTRAVKAGYAVPYLQRFVQVESLDFRRLKDECGTDQSKWDREVACAIEGQLAKLCEPMLDMVGDRKTLVFSPSVAMAQNVADYINARSEVECPSCASKRWYPTLLVGDGAKCKECGDFLKKENVTKLGIQAHCLHGEIPEQSRRFVYRDHKGDKFQFLSVCGLCREGYNDPDIACVTIFRPVSKAASSLAEQMKGRGSRPLRNCINGLDTPEERLAAIAKSEKANCLIIDLVGVTGLADCASTVQIYADGLPDEIVARAEQIALTGGVDDPEAAIEQAKREDAEEKERLRLAREAERQKRIEEAERRAKLDADVKYSTHEVGTANYEQRDPSMATEGQIKFLHMLGMDFTGWEPTKRQAGRMIGQLKEEGLSREEVAHTNRIPGECWKKSGPTPNQLRALCRSGVDARDMTPIEVKNAFDLVKQGKPVPQPFREVAKALLSDIGKAETNDALDVLVNAVKASRQAGYLNNEEYVEICAKGREKRKNIF